MGDKPNNYKPEVLGMMIEGAAKDFKALGRLVYFGDGFYGLEYDKDEPGVDPHVTYAVQGSARDIDVFCRGVIAATQYYVRMGFND